MSDERKIELFNEMIDYIQSIDTERCVECLKELGITRSEAIDLEFFDFVTDQIPESYE